MSATFPLLRLTPPPRPPPPAAHQARRPHGRFAEARRETVYRPGQALPTQCVRLENRELPLARKPQTGHRETNEPHGLRQPHAAEKGVRPAEDGEAVLRRIVRVGAGDGGEVSKAELERHRPARIA